MRDKPTLVGNVLCVIPYEDSVNLLEELKEEMTIGGKTGVWSKVEWNEKTGWVFGGFLTESITGTITVGGGPMEVELFEGTKDDLVEMFKNNHWEIIGKRPTLLIITNNSYSSWTCGSCDGPEAGKIIFESDNKLIFIPDSGPSMEYMGDLEHPKLIKEKHLSKYGLKRMIRIL